MTVIKVCDVIIKCLADKKGKDEQSLFKAAIELRKRLTVKKKK